MQQSKALTALREADLEWVRRLQDVWRDDSGHIPELNRGALDAVVAAMSRIGMDSPLGRVVVGAAGSGKTHLLGALRAALAGRAWFVLVDMTDVRDFWETVLQGYLESLREPLPGGGTQFQILLREILAHLAQNSGSGAAGSDYDRVREILRRQPLSGIEHMVRWLITRQVARRYPDQTREYQDVLRALLLLNAEDFEVSNLGYSWLLGLDLEDGQRRACGFVGARRDQKHVVQGLSWLMSLVRPSLLALDQLDAIVGQYAAASRAGESQEQTAAQSILLGIGNGLLALRDTARRTLTLLSCVEVTWDALSKQTHRAVAARFEAPIFLQVESASLVRRMVEARLGDAYQRSGFAAPYPSWPFRPEAFEGAAGLRPPREVLIDCAAHRDACVGAGTVHELKEFGRTPPQPPAAATDAISRRFSELLVQADVRGLIGDEGEDLRLGQLIANACVCAVRELRPVPERDLLPEFDFPGGQRAPALHARLRIVEHAAGGRERHYCFRALNRSNAIAFQNRLRLATTAAGIGPNLSFRRLVIVRNSEPPRGDKTQKQTRDFVAAGGRFVACTHDDLQRLLALDALCKERPPGLDEWLRQARPASVLSFLQESGFVTDTAVSPGDQAAAAAASSSPSPAAAASASTSAPTSAASDMPSARPEPPPSPAPPAAPAPTRTETLVFGQRMGAMGGAAAQPLSAFARHVAVLASPGSGKTVLLRRLVEEAALLGVPSIVVDPGNDLARLGDPWPEPPPSGWARGDDDKARAYFARVQVCVWTPGRPSGRNLNLAPLPDFAGLDGEELEQAIEMAAASLAPIVAGGRSATNDRRIGLLKATLRHFAAAGARGLDALIDLLQALPPEASTGDTQAGKLGADMANLLRAQLHGNPLWRQAGAPLDIAELFGVGAARTRISVINLMGLQSLEAQQSFVNALAMALFGWIRRNPAPPERPLRGLLVLDEAKDFVPSRHATVCKANLLRLVQHARKYGLGLVFATQEPQSIDHYVTSSCATQVYGRAGSQPAIERMRSHIEERGGRGDDIARLGPGQFYVSLESATTPIKVQTPLCLSWHPPTPLAPEDVIARARRHDEE